MTIRIDAARGAVQMIKEQLAVSTAIEAQQWQAMTEAVCLLIDKVSQVTCARLEENASIAKEIAQAKSYREQQRVLNKSLFVALLEKVKVIESAIAVLEKQVEQIKKDITPPLSKPQLSCSWTEFKEATQKIRAEYYPNHEHSIPFGGNKSVQLFHTCPAKGS